MNMDRFLKNFGQRLRTLRKTCGLSQEKFAEKLNLSTNTISTIETGKTFIKYPTLKNICKALNISPEELFNWGKESDELITEIIISAKTLTPVQQKQLIEIIKTFNK